LQLETVPPPRSHRATQPSRIAPSIRPDGATAVAPTTAAAPPVPSPGLWAMLWPQLRPYKWLLATAFLLNAAHGVAITFQTLTPKYLIDSVLLPTGITTAQRWHRMAVLAAVYLFASVFARMLVWHVGLRLFTYVRERALFGLRAQFFRHVNHLCLRFHGRNHSGELFNYLFGNPLQQVQAYFQQLAFGAAGALVVLVSTLVWLGAWDPLLSGILLGTVAITVLLMDHTRRKVQVMVADYQKVESSVTGYVADLLRGSRDVKLYAMEPQVAAAFDERVWEVGRKSYEREVRGHALWMRQETMSYVAFAGLCVASGWRYMGGHLTIGQVQAYLAAFTGLQAAMTTLFQLSTQKGAAQAGMDRISAVLRTASTTPDPVGLARPIPIRADLEFRDVTFGYEPDRPVLNGVTLTIPYGQKVALVGPSGAGKSTVTQLLLRLYDPDRGTVSLSGVDLRHLNGHDLRQHFGVVPQDPFIFRTSIRENLRVARPAATDDEIRTACERANAWEFIQRLPDRLDSRVGEGGSTLSGGQRQRLSIARALLADPDYFVFDEATSALDTVSEHLVQAAMENAVADRTALIIAHRLATVRTCDRILVCDAGRIAQDGTYDELVAEVGLFRDLVRGQGLR
jgi:ABC-type multidrug transport system fused ATPase/permease subunit